MELLKEMKDEKFPVNEKNIILREASRIVAIDSDGLIPLLFVSKHGYHKLPGGGIDEGESMIQALQREVLEETGCRVNVLGELGMIIEYRSSINFEWKWDMKQISYCYWGKIISKNAKPDFTADELSEGFQLIWLTIEEAIKQLDNDQPNNFEGGFIRERDITFLMRAKDIIKEK